MQYFFVLGNNPALSIAEIQAVLGKNKYELINQQILLVDLEKEISARELISQLGGTIKIGMIKDSCINHFPKILSGVEKIINNRNWNDFSGKFKFGFSAYGLKVNLKSLGMETKKVLKEKKISCRWVISKEPVLSSVVVEQNKMIDKGIEFVLFTFGSKVFLGQTLAVQPFKALSARDYGRPARDDQSGMLPPKLAQIMINLARADKKEILLDPFCGSGTVLSEAMLMGFTKLIGADISKQAIQDTKTNLQWIKKKQDIKIAPELYQSDARNISEKIKQQIGAIVTEPYLGPQRGKVDIKKTAQELSQLYSQVLAEFEKVIKKNGRIVMVWPIWEKDKGLDPKFNNWQIVAPISADLQSKELKITERNTIIYGRLQQKVWREIVILQKK
ncbi:MAG: DNA methyltransferase [bacterium]